MSKTAPNHDDAEVQTGERYKQCPVTGDWYRITEWAEPRYRDRIVPLERERVDAEDVPEGWREH